MDVIFVFIYWIKSSFSQYYSHMRTRFFVFPACLVSSFIQYNTYIESYDQSMLIMFSFAIKNPYYIFLHLRLFFEFDFLFQYFQDTQSAAAISLVKFPHLWNFRMGAAVCELMQFRSCVGYSFHRLRWWPRLFMLQQAFRLHQRPLARRTTTQASAPSNIVCEVLSKISPQMA